MNRSMNQMTEHKKRGANNLFGRFFLFAIAGATVAMLMATVMLAVLFGSDGLAGGLSEYEKQAIEVVAMQNEITGRWNQTVDMFNGSYVTSQRDHIVLFTASLDAVHDLITDSQAVINRWREIGVPDENVVSYQLGLKALMATQDGLILFEQYFQSSVDTLVSDQLQAENASAKLVYAAELWQAAADMAATES